MGVEVTQAKPLLRSLQTAEAKKIVIIKACSRAIGQRYSPLVVGVCFWRRRASQASSERASPQRLMAKMPRANMTRVSPWLTLPKHCDNPKTKIARPTVRRVEIAVRSPSRLQPEASSRAKRAALSTSHDNSAFGTHDSSRI